MPAQILINNYDRSQLMLRNPFIHVESYTDSGSGSTLTTGTIMGKVFATGALLPCKSDATDGSQIPIGVLADTYVVTASATIPVDLYIRGEVNSLLLVLAKVGDTLNTTVGVEGTGGTIRDLLIRNTEIMIIDSTDLSNLDNQ